MKKLAAILLLALLAFNWFGYRLYMDLLEQKASTALQTRLDNNQYDQEKLVEVKIPVNLPYLSNWSAFEKYQGETEINGIHYKYVKRKLVNDTLILLCISNEAKNELRSVQSDYFKKVNDIQNDDKKSGHGKDHSVKIPITDYLLKETNMMLELKPDAAQHHSNYLDRLLFISPLVDEQPPEC